MQKVYLVQSFHCFELVSQIKEGWSCTRVILPASQHHVVPTFHLKQVGTWYTYGILNQIETKHMSCFHDEFIAITQNCLTCYFLECGYANRYANIFQILNNENLRKERNKFNYWWRKRCNSLKLFNLLLNIT